MKKSFLIVSFLSIFTFLYSFSNSVKASEQQTIKNIREAFDVSKVINNIDGNDIILTDDIKGQTRGVATLKNKIDFGKPFTLNGKINLGNSGNKYGDGISFGFSTDNTNAIGRAGGGVGISGLNNAFGFKIDTYYNNANDNGSEIDNGFYNPDPSSAYVLPPIYEDSLFNPSIPYGAFVKNIYNNGKNTSETIYKLNHGFMDSNYYNMNPKNIEYNNGYQDISIEYDVTSLKVTIGKISWQINISDLSSNKQPKSFFIAGSNGYEHSVQKFHFDSVTYTPYPTINLNYKDSNGNYIYNNEVNDDNSSNKKPGLDSGQTDEANLNNSIKYSSDVIYDYSTGKYSYKFHLPQLINGYHFKKIDNKDQTLSLEDGFYKGEFNNISSGPANIDAIYEPNQVIFKYVDENGNSIPNENDVEKTFVTVKDGKSYYTNFKNNYIDDTDVNKTIPGYTLQDGQTDSFNVDFRDNSVVTLKYKKNEPEIKQGTIIVIYQDQNSKFIRSKLSMQGEINSDYTINIPEINGYKFKSVESNKHRSGKYTNEETTVVLNYEKVTDEPTPVDPVPTPPLSKGTVTVHYLDEYGKEFNKKVTSGNVGDSYSVATPNDGNYQFTSVSKGNLNGNYIDGNIDVYLNYKLIKNDNNSNYDNNGLLKKDTIVYPTKSMNLYKSNRFSKTNLLRHYTNKPMVNKPIFVVDGHGKSKTGLLRYKVHEMNHKNRVGYITVRKDYVLPVYETNFKGKVTVISAGGINEYSKKNLTRKLIHYKQGQTLDVKGIAWNKRSTRYVLNNGTFITSNKTLVSKGVQKQVKSFTAKKGLTIYNDVQLSKKVKTVKKTKTMLIKNWDYSDKDNILKHGSLRYRVSGGYVYAGSKYVKNVK
ncbi:lectin-like domain-containing protein [Apilactobacillus ozensis]|uniref:lectin-like domain-containing protein n=1 Tax=Apilactobacillus ozensis TaxID=866801 RepID=UPI00200A9028|nr:MucBP domain-containing protein [Apilactobacillus ozensis]MCK8607044.1 MucBP domain-containing protein [Apilactobacillus ozensis]